MRWVTGRHRATAFRIRQPTSAIWHWRRTAIWWRPPGRKIQGPVLRFYLQQFSGSTWSSVDGSATGGGLSDTVGDSRNPTLAYNGGTLFAAWEADDVTATENLCQTA